MSVSMLGGAVPAGVPQPRDPSSLASINAAAALRNYKLNPRIGECAAARLQAHEQRMRRDRCAPALMPSIHC